MPVFGLTWPWYQFPKLSMGIFDLVLTTSSEIGEKNSKELDIIDENVNFGFIPSLAIFGLL